MPASRQAFGKSLVIDGDSQCESYRASHLICVRLQHLWSHPPISLRVELAPVKNPGCMPFAPWASRTINHGFSALVVNVHSVRARFFTPQVAVSGRHTWRGTELRVSRIDHTKSSTRQPTCMVSAPGTRGPVGWASLARRQPPVAGAGHLGDGTVLRTGWDTLVPAVTPVPIHVPICLIQGVQMFSATRDHVHQFGSKEAWLCKRWSGLPINGCPDS